MDPRVTLKMQFLDEMKKSGQQVSFKKKILDCVKICFHVLKDINIFI